MQSSGREEKAVGQHESGAHHTCSGTCQLLYIYLVPVCDTAAVLLSAYLIKYSFHWNQTTVCYTCCLCWAPKPSHCVKVYSVVELSRSLGMYGVCGVWYYYYVCCISLYHSLCDGRVLRRMIVQTRGRAVAQHIARHMYVSMCKNTHECTYNAAVKYICYHVYIHPCLVFRFFICEQASAVEAIILHNI